jgi:hypothetical protein
MDNSQSTDSVNPEALVEVMDLDTGILSTVPQEISAETVVDSPSGGTEEDSFPPPSQFLSETSDELETLTIGAIAQYDWWPEAKKRNLKPEDFANKLLQKLVRRAMKSTEEELGCGLTYVLLKMRDSGELTEFEYQKLCEINDIRDSNYTDRHVGVRIDMVIKAASDRRIVRLAHRLGLMVTDGNNQQAEVITKELSELLKGTGSNSRSKRYFEDLKARQFDPDHPVESIPALISLDGTPAVRRGNISTATAQTGAGKSSVMNAIMKTSTVGGRHLGFEGRVSGKIVYLDFEQSHDDFDEALRFRAGATETDQIIAYHLTGYSHVEARKALFSIIENQKDLELLIVDGYADCVSSPNAEEECFEFVSQLLFAAQEHQIAILGVLHLNPGSESKSRGHLGSHLERKSETVIQIDEHQGVREMWTSKARKKPIHKGKGLRFAWSDEHHGFRELEGTASEMKMAAKTEEWARLLYDIQSKTDMLAWNFTTLKKEICAVEGTSARTASTRIKQLCEAGLLKHDAGRGIYTSTLPSATA